MPYDTTGLSGGGGDPVFAYDSNGKLYFVWIDLYASSTMDFLMGTAYMGIFWAYSNDNGATWPQPTHDTILLGEMQMQMGQPSAVNSPISDKEWLAVDRTGGQYNDNLYISYVTIDQDATSASYNIKCKTKPAGVDEFTTEATITDTANFPFVQFGSITVDNNGGVHVFFYGTQDQSTMALYHSVSNDGGANFSTPNKISNVKLDLYMLNQTTYDSIPGVNNQRLYPSNYGSCDPNTGDLYITWTAFGIDTDAGNGADIYFSKSTDGGSSWSTPQIINDDPTGSNTHNFFSSIFIDESGKISLSWYDRREDTANINTHYYGTHSTDGGNTWAPNYKITTSPTDFSTVGDQNEGFGVGEYTQILSTPSGYNTIPIWADGRTNDGDMNVYIAFMNDQTTGLPEIRAVTDNFSLKSIFPNPVDNQAKISFEIKKSSDVSVSIISADGRKVKQITPKYYPSGEHTITADMSDIAAGNYVVLVRAGEYYNTKPIVIK